MARLLGASFGRGLLHQVDDPENVVRDGLRLHDAVVRGLLARHFLHRDHATGARRASKTSAMRLTARDTRVQPEDRIAQRHQERLLAGEVLGAQHGVAQALLHALAGVEEVGLEGFEIEFLEQVLLVGLGSACEQLGVVIEMVLDRGLAAAGDEQDLLDSVGDQFFDHVLHDGLARHRQHLLGLRLGGRQQPRAQPRHGDYRAFDHNSEYSNLRIPRPWWTLHPGRAFAAVRTP